MKYLKQFFIIISISFIGEFLGNFIYFQIPASVLGLLILLFCLCVGIIKLDDIAQTGDFLLQIMPLLFIPNAVALITMWEPIKAMLLPIVIAIIIITAIVIVISGHVTQFVVKKRSSKDDK